jgi:hypothetical protein
MHITNLSLNIKAKRYVPSTVEEVEPANGGSFGKLSQILLDAGLSPTAVMAQAHAQLSMVFAYGLHQHGCGPAGCERVVGWSTSPSAMRAAHT